MGMQRGAMWAAYLPRIPTVGNLLDFHSREVKLRCLPDTWVNPALRLPPLQGGRRLGTQNKQRFIKRR